MRLPITLPDMSTLLTMVVAPSTTTTMPARTGAPQSQAILAAAQHQGWHQHASTTVTAPTSDFQPDRPIGYGAFGVVWSVTDPRDGKRVALKKLPNVFQSLVRHRSQGRELKMMR